ESSEENYHQRRDIRPNSNSSAITRACLPCVHLSTYPVGRGDSNCDVSRTNHSSTALLPQPSAATTESNFAARSASIPATNSLKGSLPEPSHKSKTASSMIRSADESGPPLLFLYCKAVRVGP